MHAKISNFKHGSEESDVGSCLEEPPTPAGSRTVLCIEDNPLYADLVKETLTARPDVNIIMATDGAKGVDLACLYKPDLILLDLQLPDFNGEEVLHRLRGDARTSALPVIIISGGASSRDAQRFLAAGASGYLDKPFTTSAFLTTFDRLLPLRPAA